MKTLESAHHFIFSGWTGAFLFFFLFFSFLYFGGTFMATLLLRRLKARQRIHPIRHALQPEQVKKEVLRSLLSIFVFSLQAIPMQWLMQLGYFSVRFTNAWSCLWEIPLLFLWNEVHFYGCHWLLHRRFLLRHVHYIHHQSKEPTVFSVFSFHWAEAFMLGTVIFFPLAIHDFHIFSVLSLPVMSIVLNLAGHSNHEPDTGKDREHVLRFTFRHTLHHKWSQGNYGFMLPFLDRFFKTSLPKSKN